MDKLLLECLGVRCQDAQDWILMRLEALGYKPTGGSLHTMADGDVPVCLVAHTDTVWSKPPATVYHDAARRVIWAGSGGLGADDRIGVYVILRLLEEGLRPSVCFPDKEETGGEGALEAGKEWAPDVKLLIQLDRQGSDDAVTYSHHPCKPMRKWLRRHGWQLDTGTFSDISVLMPAWGLGGVNLSVGYYGQHTAGEHAKLDEVERTIDRVRAMMFDLPHRPWLYRERREKLRWLDWKPQFKSHNPLLDDTDAAWEGEGGYHY